MSMVTPALLELLADPETHEPLALASDHQLVTLREAVRTGRAARRNGQPPASEIEGALLSQAGRIAYLIEGGIPNLLIDDRLELSPAL